MENRLQISHFLKFSLFFVSLIYASQFPYKFGFSLNYPGIGAKYILKKNIFELRFQRSEDEQYTATIFGLRYYRYFPKNIFYLYAGLEAAGLDTKSRLSDNGSGGIVSGGFAGVEKFLFKNFSINLDIGPYVATATTGNVSVTEFDFVLNLSLNFYLK